MKSAAMAWDQPSASVASTFKSESTKCSDRAEEVLRPEVVGGSHHALCVMLCSADSRGPNVGYCRCAETHLVYSEPRTCRVGRLVFVVMPPCLTREFVVGLCRRQRVSHRECHLVDVRQGRVFETVGAARCETLERERPVSRTVRCRVKSCVLRQSQRQPN
jgi:hypothetical protein